MTVDVLTRSLDNTRARIEMRRRGLDFVTSQLTRLLRKAHLIRGVNVGLRVKSWDVLRTLQFVEQHVDKNTAILDLGACTSEILLSLCKMGFTDLTGIDLDPALARMPHSQSIKYMAGDFTQTTFPADTFGAITAISVLEHGFCGPKMFREISRLLKTGGYFVGSTDYWPEKVDTSGVAVYGLDWTVFSKDELLNLIEAAGKYRLFPVGELNFEASDRTIRWLKRDYTFAWFAFQKVGVPEDLIEKGSAL
jgi:SAM-dependent methyltransferase